ncbi:MAG: cellobiose phosphorylase, partial [Candidatus Omnitrophica bacterium]|nr:cellobiose phosphorylase [Candidatus Omnitrophota bacterium]
MTDNPLWKFLDDTGTFVAKNPHKVSKLYFPLANEKGLLSSITPTLHGDIKIDQDTFLMPPVSAEDLSNSRYNRNFWIYIQGYGAWSAASGEVDKSLVEA